MTDLEVSFPAVTVYDHRESTAARTIAFDAETGAWAWEREGSVVRAAVPKSRDAEGGSHARSGLQLVAINFARARVEVLDSATGEILVARPDNRAGDPDGAGVSGAVAVDEAIDETIDETIGETIDETIDEAISGGDGDEATDDPGDAPWSAAFGMDIVHATVYAIPSRGWVLVVINGDLYVVDPATLTVLATGPAVSAASRRHERDVKFYTTSPEHTLISAGQRTTATLIAHGPAADGSEIVMTTVLLQGLSGCALLCPETAFGFVVLTVSNDDSEMVVQFDWEGRPVAVFPYLSGYSWGFGYAPGGRVYVVDEHSYLHCIQLRELPQ